MLLGLVGQSEPSLHGTHLNWLFPRILTMETMVVLWGHMSLENSWEVYFWSDYLQMAPCGSIMVAVPTSPGKFML